MQLKDFNFELPESLIAVHPATERTHSRLLFLNRENGSMDHRRFDDIEHYLRQGDVLVLNNTKVIPARLLGLRDSGGQAEALLLKNFGEGKWEALLRPGGKIKKGAQLSFSQAKYSLNVEVLDDGQENSPKRLVQLKGESAHENLQHVGHMPLPPYIQRRDTPNDKERYQTVFSKHEGAIAAPTAGLHFDQALLERLKLKGVEVAYVTLHVSYGTFQPVSEDIFRGSELFEEEFEVSAEAAEIVNRARKENRRVIACGTTSVRTLESACDTAGELSACRGKTKIFIKPPYVFKITSGLITNFHLPQSTLLMLVSAFSGREKVLKAYREAINERYRFYSYGDAMLIL